MSKNDRLFAVANTLSAGWLELRLAKWFGKRLQMVYEDGTKVTLSLWKGRVYFIDYDVGHRSD